MSYSTFKNLMSGQEIHNTSSKYTLLKQERFYVIIVESYTMRKY